MLEKSRFIFTLKSVAFGFMLLGLNQRFGKRIRNFGRNDGLKLFYEFGDHNSIL